MKSVLISIQPKWCKFIASGEKTIEVRKTAPKLQTPFKCYIYCTKKEFNKTIFDYLGLESVRAVADGQGMVIGEFVCDRVTQPPYSDLREFCCAACLTPYELYQYTLNAHTYYGWHISNLKIYNKPKELVEFKSVKVIRGYHKENETGIERLLHSKRVQVNYLTRPPQSWCYVEEL